MIPANTETTCQTDTFLCTHCGQICSCSDMTELDGDQLCPVCRDELTVVCGDCGVRIWLEDNYGDEHGPLCERCRENNYSRCLQCGRLITRDDVHYLQEDDDEGYCYTCFCNHRSSRVIHDYYFKPAPIFYGSGDRFFGVELEMDGAGESETNARQVLAVANRDGDRAYVKHDGSLDDGFELVTEPHTLDAHQQGFPWPAVLEKAVSLGYTSHQAHTCGLHVHVNRSAFGNTHEEQEDVIARILFFVENHWNELLRFSRRTRRQMEEWAARYGRKDNPKDILHTAKYGRERHTCVNLLNADTIEFRMFRGTLKYSTLMATLQMADRICDVALAMSDGEMQNISWSEFVSGCTAPELVQYLKERRLYVNEPVGVSEEV